MQQPHVFSADPLDRADRERRDGQWIEARLADPTSRFLAFADMRVLVRHEPSAELGWQDRACLVHLRDGAEPVLLGNLNGVAYFAFDASGSAGLDEHLKQHPQLVLEEPRAIATQLSIAQSGLLAHAKSLVDWHARHRFCANCGGSTNARSGGKERRCVACDAAHFPRTDPVVIMLVHDGDRCLLGRNQRRVTRLYSALAGFVDQGESIEEAVRREIMEESGIKVGRVDYHSSQPWPFPSSLMIGCIAEALNTTIDFDEHELADVRWFGREEVLHAFEQGGETGEGFYLPNPIAIAHHLIKDWANGNL